MPADRGAVQVWLRRCAAVLHEQRAALTHLDAATGDGDYGINMDRGFAAVVDRLQGMGNTDIGAILKTVGSTLVSTVGGASGPLYGTAFLRAGGVLVGKQPLDTADVLAGLTAALEGIQARGREQRGEKTMIDALAPAIDALRAAMDGGLDLRTAMRAAAEAAEAGAAATKELTATKGRASYLGERSRGHADPGATSIALLLRAAVDG